MTVPAPSANFPIIGSLKSKVDPTELFRVELSSKAVSSHPKTSQTSSFQRRKEKVTKNQRQTHHLWFALVAARFQGAGRGKLVSVPQPSWLSSFVNLRRIPRGQQNNCGIVEFPLHWFLSYVMIYGLLKNFIIAEIGFPWGL